MYIKSSEARIFIMSMYVDDIIYASGSEIMMLKFKMKIMNQYEMSDLGLLHHFLRLEIVQSVKYIFIHQKKCAKTLLERFGLKDYKAVSTPLAVNGKLCKADGNESADEGLHMKIMGSLLYLIATRLDLMYTTCLLAQFMHSPTRKHLGIAKRVLRYVQGTLDFGIENVKGKVVMLIGYCDSD